MLERMIQAHDFFVSWDNSTKERNLHLVATKTQILILLKFLPNVFIAHKIISLNVKRISEDLLSFRTSFID